ncbi:hypothetical protein GCM10022237_36570 [Nocardioides ginsengisoli]|uniref:ATP-binding protein n=1 Tax=Nocardioides ginsengisoli TaxID=363868 RepID=A0ABW3VW83_9ACTN
MNRRLTLDILGEAVEIVGPEPDLARVRRQWERCLTDAPAARTVELLTWLDADTRESTLASGLSLLGIQLNDDRLNLHAAGLSDAAGRVVALVAESGTGKTTAAWVLGRQLGYVSDECVSVDPDTLAVLPFPKPLSLVTTDDAPKRQWGPDDLGLRHPPASLGLASIVLLDRTAAPGEARLEPVALIDAVQSLVLQTSSTARMTAPLAALARLVNRTGGCLRLRYHDIADAADLLVAHLAHPEPRAEELTHLPLPDGDAIVVGDQVLALIGDRVVRGAGAQELSRRDGRRPD